MESIQILPRRTSIRYSSGSIERLRTGFALKLYDGDELIEHCEIDSYIGMKYVPETILALADYTNGPIPFTAADVRAYRATQVEAFLADISTDFIPYTEKEEEPGFTSPSSCKVGMVVASHLSDIQSGLLDSEDIRIRCNFVKWLLLNYTDTTRWINPELAWEEFSKTRFAQRLA